MLDKKKNTVVIDIDY